MFIAFIFVLLFCNCFANQEKNEETVEFNVRPGFDESASVTLNGVTCTFSFSCNGGSSELFTINLKKREDKQSPYLCTVGRPQPPSYLQFKLWSLTLEGAKIHTSEALDGFGKPLTAENQDFVVDDHTGTTSSISMVSAGGKKLKAKKKKDL